MCQVLVTQRWIKPGTFSCEFMSRKKASCSNKQTKILHHKVIKAKKRKREISPMFSEDYKEAGRISVLGMQEQRKTPWPSPLHLLAQDLPSSLNVPGDWGTGKSRKELKPSMKPKQGSELSKLLKKNRSQGEMESQSWEMGWGGEGRNLWSSDTNQHFLILVLYCWGWSYTALHTLLLLSLLFFGKGVRITSPLWGPLA